MSEMDYSYLPPEDTQWKVDTREEMQTKLDLLRQSVGDEHYQSGWDVFFPMDENDLDALERYAG